MRESINIGSVEDDDIDTRDSLSGDCTATSKNRFRL